MARWMLTVLLFIGVPLSMLSQSAPAVSGQQAPAVKPTSASLGVYVYPKQNQDGLQQAKDEQECYGWAKQQTGIDPAAPPPEPAEAKKVKGAGAKGAAAGAGGGAAVGAIVGDAGEGAAAGAVIGGMKGRRQQRQANKQAEKQAEAAAKQQQEQRIGTFRKGFSACLEGRGYSVK